MRAKYVFRVERIGLHFGNKSCDAKSFVLCEIRNGHNYGIHSIILRKIYYQRVNCALKCLFAKLSSLLKGIVYIQKILSLYNCVIQCWQTSYTWIYDNVYNIKCLLFSISLIKVDCYLCISLSSLNNEAQNDFFNQFKYCVSCHKISLQ